LKKNAPLAKIYHTLLNQYGRQGWWPTTPLQSDRPVYHPGKSLAGLKEGDIFEICLGAILTQNTSWDNVVKVLTHLKQRKRLHLKALHHLSPKILEKDVRSSGYFRQKAKKIKKFVDEVMTHAGGSVRKFLTGPLKEVRLKLLSLYGIGPETADSMLLYAAGQPIFVVDAYTRRIGTRWGILKGKESYDKIQDIFMRNIPKSPSLYGEFHALLVELAKRHCRKTPICAGCPVRILCRTGQKRQGCHLWRPENEE
jgi:endonuclease-3 related protein